MASLHILSLAFAAVPPLQASNPCFTVGKLFPSEQNGQERIDTWLVWIADNLGNKKLMPAWTLSPNASVFECQHHASSIADPPKQLFLLPDYEVNKLDGRSRGLCLQNIGAAFLADDPRIILFPEVPAR